MSEAHARAQRYRERHRAYGVLVPCAEVPMHLINGWRIICDAEEITDVVLMRWPMAAPHEVPARPTQSAAPHAVQNGGHLIMRRLIRYAGYDATETQFRQFDRARLDRVRSVLGDFYANRDRFYARIEYLRRQYAKVRAEFARRDGASAS